MSQMRLRGPVPKQVVVMGCGDWAKKYAKALQPYVERKECHVIFCYDSRAGHNLTPKQYHRYLRGILANVGDFELWGDGCQCWDVADGRTMERLQGLRLHAVFIVTPDATHCSYAKSFLAHARHIVVEKPFDATSANVSTLIDALSGMPDTPAVAEVWGFDHYLVRAHEFVAWTDLTITRSGESLSGQQARGDGYLAFLGGDVTHFRFHMLEGKSRGVEERAPSLQNGLIMDMAPHALALVLPFGFVESIETTSVRAAMYEGSELYMRPQDDLKGGRETFAAIGLTFKSAISGRMVSGEVRVGKGVGKQDEKFAEVTGANGNRIRIDLATFIVDYIDADTSKVRPVTHLFAEPIDLLVREIMADRPLASLFPPETGHTVVAVLERWCEPVTDYLQHTALPFYKRGDSSETIVERVEPLPLIR